MSSNSSYDAVVVGAGPNGLAAAITLARAGRAVLLVEGAGTVGGGSRSAELTLPGFIHDVCSAVHPLGAASPFFRELPLADHGLEWLHPEVPLAHPLDGGRVALLERSVADTAANLREDASAYRHLIEPVVRHLDDLLAAFLAPPRLPRRPLPVAAFALRGLRSAVGQANARLQGDRARALFAGNAAHGLQSLHHLPTAAFGLLFSALGHAVGWPIARGGSQAIADALAAHLTDLGGEIRTGCPVGTLDELPEADAYLLDVTPRQLDAIAGERLSASYRRALRRWRYGAGVFKVDWALDGPIPWAAEGCTRAGTVHVGGTLEEVAAAEDEVVSGRHPDRPFVLVAQSSRFDPTRAPAGHHTGWAYCHVPNGSTVDMTERIERQIERFAPSFTDRILARSTKNTVAMEADNPNYVGGDINGGAASLRQLVVRPVLRPVPYATSDERIFLCSSSTPPGGGVHGLCGYFAGRAVLQRQDGPRVARQLAHERRRAP